MSRLSFVACLLYIALALAGCGYRFTADSGSRLAPGQKVWVAYFENNTVYTNASVVLKRALFDQFASMRSILPAGRPDDGDIVVEGKLTGYGNSILSYTAIDTAREYRLTITAEVTVKRKTQDKTGKPLWKGTVTTWQDYPIGSTIEIQRSSEDAALSAAASKLAQKVIFNLEQNY